MPNQQELQNLINELAQEVATLEQQVVAIATKTADIQACFENQGGGGGGGVGPANPP